MECEFCGRPDVTQCDACRIILCYMRQIPESKFRHFMHCIEKAWNTMHDPEYLLEKEESKEWLLRIIANNTER